jgi:hypothetical protein
MPEDLPLSLVGRLSEIAKEKDDYLLNDRIQRELTPAIEQNQAILSTVAEALEEEQPQKMEQSLSILRAAFQDRKCDIVEDDSLASDNWGSLSYENNRWMLRVRPEMTQALPFALTEYIHELGALSLIQQSLRLRGLKVPVSLSFEKSRLVIKTKEGEIALTHLFDQVLKKMVEARQTHQSDADLLIVSDYVNPAKKIEPGQDPFIAHQMTAHQESSDNWQATRTPDYLKQRLQAVYARELSELQINLDDVKPEEIVSLKDRLVEHRRKMGR